MSRSPLILASASPRRIELLRAWGYRFTVDPSHVSERPTRRVPSAIVRELALRKACATARKYHAGIVIGADTIVVLKGRILGKPRDRAHAARMLSSLSGTVHAVYTGVALVDAASGRCSVAYDRARVRMRRFVPGEAARLAAKHLDKAGAYAVQETDDAFVESINGDYYTVVGLPRALFRGMLRAFRRGT